MDDSPPVANKANSAKGANSDNPKPMAVTLQQEVINNGSLHPKDSAVKPNAGFDVSNIVLKAGPLMGLGNPSGAFD